MNNELKRIREQLQKYEKSQLLRLMNEIQKVKNEESRMNRNVQNTPEMGMNKTYVNRYRQLNKSMKNLTGVLEKQPHKNDMRKVYEKIRDLKKYNETRENKTNNVIKEMTNKLKEIEKNYTKLENKYNQLKYTTFTGNVVNNGNNKPTLLRSKRIT
jgi:DNA repair exonuclease SbcCD ATPase subunit